MQADGLPSWECRFGPRRETAIPVRVRGVSLLNRNNGHRLLGSLHVTKRRKRRLNLAKKRLNCWNGGSLTALQSECVPLYSGSTLWLVVP
jgi:hypothetical protein